MWLYAIQLGVLALGLLLLLAPAVRHALTPETARRDRARGLARDQFVERGLHRTAARTGILFFVSLGDRCAEVISDAGVEGPLPDEAWRPCLDGLLAEARAGRLAEGIVAALGRMGEMLGEKVPAGPATRMSYRTGQLYYRALPSGYCIRNLLDYQSESLFDLSNKNGPCAPLVGKRECLDSFRYTLARGLRGVMGVGRLLGRAGDCV